MTQINFDFGHPSADGVAVLAGELVHVVPTERFKVGKRIVVRDSFDVRLSETGTATVNVTPTDGTFAYEVTVGESPDVWRFVRCVQVPNSSTPVAFADLVDVDASTLAPALNTGAALTYLLASSLQEAQAMSAANPGQMVFYPEGQAKTVASQILEDLTDARAVVEAQAPCPLRPRMPPGPRPTPLRPQTRRRRRRPTASPNRRRSWNPMRMML